ncbi:MAG: hypothetical protein J4F50_03855 [Acidimicrobiia bacterium]|nr:hypothetical protein [Acidimicrobiia bacterium]
MRRPGQLLADTFSISGRRWRSCAAAGLIYLSAQVALVVLLLIAGDDILMGELGEIWDRISDPNFDPEAPEQSAYFESLELDLSPVNFVPILLGIGAVWVASNLLQAAVTRVALSDLRSRTLTASDALRQALRRVPRLLGLDLQVVAIVLVAAIVVVVGGFVTPLLLIPLVPAFLVGAVYFFVVMSLAFAFASVGPAAPSLRYGARLVRGRFWGTFGRMLLVFVVLSAVTLAVGLVFTLAGSSTPTLQLVSQLVQTVVGTAITVVGIVAVAIIYHDLGGESD